VADETSGNPGPFDVQTIRHLVALMSRHDLSEIDLRQGDQRICLRRGLHGPLPVPAALPPAQPAVAAPAPAVAAPEPDRPTKTFHLIKSPTPGTFFARPKPEAESFVRVGSRVTPTTVVCIIEAMNIFNEIQAECAGVITEILAENQQPVEWGQVLFKVDPTG
jgi:acetyl-CoA carboxylase biotin carboxyl carrier protein